MNVLIILANQKPQGSFCHALAQRTADVLTTAGHHVTVRDLYAEGFNPVLTDAELSLVQEEITGTLRKDIEQVLATDFFIIIHPNWWGMPPAILKGWIDRIVRQGFCYAFTAEGVVRKLEGRKAVVFTTANTPQEIETNVNGDPLDNLWKNIIFKTIGIDDCTHINFTSIIMSTLEQRSAWLNDAEKVVLEKIA